MPTCHILADVDRIETSLRAVRATRAEKVFTALGFKCQSYGVDICDRETAENMETQLGIEDGWRTNFADLLPSKLQLETGDFIIATEAWHGMVFRGLLQASGGKYMGAPVVELWIDYPNSFASFRIFTSRFAMYVAAGQEGATAFNKDWIVALPYVPAKLSQEALAGVEEFLKDPHSLEHVEYMARGVPVVAPDWGSWAETIKHGSSGILYRSDTGREKAVEAAAQLPSQQIVNWVEASFSLNGAAAALQRYLSRLIHG